MPGHKRHDSITVLNVAFPLLPVGPDSGGGAEQILYLMDKGLVEAGMRSLVLASEGSRIKGELIATPATRGEITDAVRAEAHVIYARRIRQIIASEKIDLIHYHGVDFYDYWASHSDLPQLATLHLPVSWYAPAVFEEDGFSVNFVSKSQADSLPGSNGPLVVTNGIDVHNFHTATTKEAYLLWLGRVCPEKGVHIAARVARHLDLPLVIAGPVHAFSAHHEYFDEQIKPLLDQKRRYVGPLGLKEKAAVLRNARCLLIPSLVAETSSLVAMEAISSGTPVVAFRSGALPEIVESGVTGFIVDSEEEMAAAVNRAGEISTGRCRMIAESRFSADRMVSEYLQLYSRLMARARLNA